MSKNQSPPPKMHNKSSGKKEPQEITNQRIQEAKIPEGSEKGEDSKIVTKTEN